ncbi:variable large family protein [Borrelia crocidurae]|nr:variable large family protein [Borrelia crocidurae]
MMMIVMGCNSGGVKGEGQVGGAGVEGRGLSGTMMEVGRSAENVFYAFIELISDILGLKVTKDTTKQQVGEYFNKLGGKLGKTSAELETVAQKVEESKDGLFSKSIRAEVDIVKKTLETLKVHLDSLGIVGDSANKVIGEIASQQSGVAADTEELKKALTALQGIVDTAKTEQVKALSSSSVTLKQDSIGVDAKDGAKVLAAGANAGAASGDKAALIVSAVSGEEMLASIVNSTEDKAKKITANATAETTPLEFAIGSDDASKLAQEAAKAAAVAGGIALRSLVKGGKLASHSGNDEKAVQSAGIAAVNKLLVAVEDIIKKTVKNVLEKVKKEVDEARKPKTSN